MKHRILLDERHLYLPGDPAVVLFDMIAQDPTDSDFSKHDLAKGYVRQELRYWLLTNWPMVDDWDIKQVNRKQGKGRLVGICLVTENDAMVADFNKNWM